MGKQVARWSDSAVEIDAGLFAVGGVAIGALGWLAWKFLRQNRAPTATSAVFVVLASGKVVPAESSSAPTPVVAGDDDGPPSPGFGHNARVFDTVIAQRASGTNYLVPDQRPLGFGQWPSHQGYVAGFSDPVAAEAAAMGLQFIGYDAAGAILIDTDGKRVKV